MRSYTVVIDADYEPGHHPGSPIGAITIEADNKNQAVRMVRTILANAVLTIDSLVYRPNKVAAFQGGVMDTDFRLMNAGTISVLFADSDAAKAWVEENISDDHQEWAGGVVIEHRGYVDDILNGIEDADLTWRRT